MKSNNKTDTGKKMSSIKKKIKYVKKENYLLHKHLETDLSS